MDIYGRPWFKAVNESGLRGVMASHNQVNYEPMHGSHLLPVLEQLAQHRVARQRSRREQVALLHTCAER